MTLQNLFTSAAGFSNYLLFFFIAMPILALILGFISGRDGYKNPWRYLYSFLIYLVSLPGIFSIVLCVYSFVFDRKSMMEVNVLIYFLPIVSMIVTLMIIRKRVDLALVPGFQKLSGLMMVMVATFIIILILQKMRFWVVFVGSMGQLALVFLVLFVILKIGYERFLR